MRRALALLLLAAPLALPAQRPSPVTLMARVVDSANAPISGADVAVVRGTSDVLAHATTDAAGRATLAVPRADGDHQLIVRKLGFQPTYRFFAMARTDTLRFDIQAARTVTSLAPVTITAAENARRQSYHLDAEAIEHSARPMIDGTDLFKLRPDMMNSRGGPQACAVPFTPRDGWIESVWVNGRRVTLAPVDSIIANARKPGLGIATKPARPNVRLTPTPRARSLPSPFPTFSHIDTVLSILATIHPEHIAEVTYQDCFDSSVGKNNSDMAMFIVLKPGIGFRDGLGSYVISDSIVAAPRSNLADLPRYRFRLLGVFDGETGQPLADAEIVEALTGDRVRTTVTGTASLFFVPEGRASLLVRRAGYRDTTLEITISPVDTVPLTVVLSPRRPLPRF